MRAKIPTFTASAIIRWRNLFLIAEALFFVAFAALCIADKTSFQGGNLEVVGLLFVTLLFFLLFVSPFFLPHFRLVATVGWCSALAALVYCLLEVQLKRW